MCLGGPRHGCLPPSCIGPQVIVIARRLTAKTTLASLRARRRSFPRLTWRPTTPTPRGAAEEATEPRAAAEEATALGQAATTRRAPGTRTAAAPRCPAAPSPSTCRPCPSTRTLSELGGGHAGCRVCKQCLQCLQAHTAGIRSSARGPSRARAPRSCPCRVCHDARLPRACRSSTSLSDAPLRSGIVLYVSQNSTDLGLHADFAGHTGSGAQVVYYGGSHLLLHTLS